MPPAPDSASPAATPVWGAPRSLIALVLALIAMIGPFSIDTYIPAFAGMAKALQATPVQMQQTLSAYLFGFAFMNLFHGALSDSFGRRPVILIGLSVFTFASAGCALADHIGTLIFFRALQGLSTGAGIVVSRAVIRDVFPPAEAQRVMAQVTIYFGVAPAIAPMIGGWIYVHLDWHAIFWLLTIIGFALWLVSYRLLPETLVPAQRQPFQVGNLMTGYRQMCSDPRFLLLTLASGIPFNGMFLYVLAAPAFLGDHLGLGPTEFFWFFLITIAGIVCGSWLSGRLAGRIKPRRQIHRGFAIMFVVAVINLVLNLVLVPTAAWAMIPMGIFSFGWALMVPVVTLLVLDLFPSRRGMASSLQAVVASTANGIVAGVIAPAVMDSTTRLAAASMGMMMVGLVAWLVLRRVWPEATLSSGERDAGPAEPARSGQA